MYFLRPCHGPGALAEAILEKGFVLEQQQLEMCFWQWLGVVECRAIFACSFGSYSLEIMASLSEGLMDLSLCLAAHLTSCSIPPFYKRDAYTTTFLELNQSRAFIRTYKQGSSRQLITHHYLGESYNFDGQDTLTSCIKGLAQYRDCLVLFKALSQIHLLSRSYHSSLCFSNIL